MRINKYQNYICFLVLFFNFFIVVCVAKQKAMGRTKLTARKSADGKAPRLQLAIRRAKKMAIEDDDLQSQIESKLQEEAEDAVAVTEIVAGQVTTDDAQADPEKWLSDCDVDETNGTVSKKQKTDDDVNNEN